MGRIEEEGVTGYCCGINAPSPRILRRSVSILRIDVNMFSRKDEGSHVGCGIDWRYRLG